MANKTSGEEHDSLTKSDAECTNTGGSHIKAWVSIQNMFFRHDKKLFFIFPYCHRRSTRLIELNKRCKVVIHKIKTNEIAKSIRVSLDMDFLMTCPEVVDGFYFIYLFHFLSFLAVS